MYIRDLKGGVFQALHWVKGGNTLKLVWAESESKPQTRGPPLNLQPNPNRKLFCHEDVRQGFGELLSLKVLASK